MADAEGGGGEAFDGTPLEPTEGTQQPAQQGQQGQDEIPKSLRSTQTPEALAHLARARRPGEPWEAVAAREWQQQRARAIREADDRKATREELRQLREELRPLLQKEWQQVQRARTEQLAAQVPEDPTERAAWLAEQTLIRLDQQERQAIEAAEAQEAAEQLDMLDEAWFEYINPDALAADPDLKTDFDALTRSGVSGIQAMYPEATTEQCLELLSLSQTLQFRDCVLRGQDPRQFVRQQAHQLRSIFGGNGQQLPVQPPGKPTSANRQSIASQRANAAAAIGNPGVNRRAGAAPGNGIDFGAMDEDAFYEAVQANPREYEAYKKQRGI